jgi:hypothetical protein
MVKGYASAVGSVALNQQLSAQDHADNVKQFEIPLTRMLAPGAMGETRRKPDRSSFSCLEYAFD